MFLVRAASSAAWRAWVAACLLGCTVGRAAAHEPAGGGSAQVEVEGHRFDTVALVAGQSLPLNGAGVSSVLSTKSTAVALYLPSRQATVQGALEVQGPKRIQYYLLRDVAARDLGHVLLDRLLQNTSPEEFAANFVQISQLGAVFREHPALRQGDMIVMDWLPAARVTEFRLNGERIGEPLQGEGFFPMMMKVWIGPRVRSSTREALLGQEP